MALAEALAVVKGGLAVADWISGMDDQDKAIEAARDMQREDQDFQAAERARDRHQQSVEAERMRNFEREKRARYERMYQGFVNRQRQVRYDWRRARGGWLKGAQKFMTPGRRGSLDDMVATNEEIAAGEKERLNAPVLPGGYPELDAQQKEVPPIGPAPPAHVPRGGPGSQVVRGQGYTRGQDTPPADDGRVAVPRGGVLPPQEAMVDPGMGTAAVLTQPPPADYGPIDPARGVPAGLPPWITPFTPGTETRPDPRIIFN